MLFRSPPAHHFSQGGRTVEGGQRPLWSCPGRAGWIAPTLCLCLPAVPGVAARPLGGCLALDCGGGFAPPLWFGLFSVAALPSDPGLAFDVQVPWGCWCGKRSGQDSIACARSAQVVGKRQWPTVPAPGVPAIPYLLTCSIEQPPSRFNSPVNEAKGADHRCPVMAAVPLRQR